VLLLTRLAKSRQQDCVLVDTRLPLIDIGSEKDVVLLAESVLATIEIKSYLDSKELESTLESIAATRRLACHGQQIYSKGGVIIKVENVLPILTYIFAYDGLELASIAEGITEFAHAGGDGGLSPDAVCVLKKGIVLRSPAMPVMRGQSVTLPSLSHAELTFTSLSKDALFAFYRRMIDDVVPLQIINIDLDKYYSMQELE
jgi:hypothetical protein